MKNKICGIYLITEKETGRGYVGQAINVERRWRRHFRRFPKDRFDYRVILECSRSDLDFWEKFYIKSMKTFWTEGGFNKTRGGQYWFSPESPLSSDTIEKIRQRLKGIKRSEETKKRMSLSMKGLKPVLTDEERKRRSEFMKGNSLRVGKIHTPETIEKISKTRKSQPGTFKGKTHSEETKEKISKTKTGSVLGPHSEERKQKQSESMKGKNVGKTHSEEARQKMSAAGKARRARERAAKAAAIAATEALIELEIISSPA